MSNRYVKDEECVKNDYVKETDIYEQSLSK